VRRAYYELGLLLFSLPVGPIILSVVHKYSLRPEIQGVLAILRQIKEKNK
jgi:hypothetical protein